MKRLIEHIIQKRNPKFKFASEVSNRVIFLLIRNNLITFIRGLKVIFNFRKPGIIFLEKGVKFFNLNRIQFGSMVKIGAYSYLSANSKKGIKIGNNTSIGAFSRIIVATSFDNPGKHIIIGDNVGIGEYAYLGGAGGLEIGDECIIGQYLSCHPENHNFDNSSIAIRHQGVTRKGIKVGSNCWIGSKVTILDGVSIGNNCVIAAGAVVTKNFPSDVVIGGVPAKIIKTINKNREVA